MTESDKSDVADLLSRPAFLRFIGRMFERSGVMSVATGDATLHPLYNEGRRSLMMETLGECEEAQPVSKPGLPVLTLIQMLREAAQSAPKEKVLGRRRDPYGDLDGSGDDASG